MELKQNTPADLIGTFHNVNRLLVCTIKCNQKPLCKFMHFDQSTGVCRIYIGGRIVPSMSTTSIVGTVQYNAGLYSSRGKLCTNHNCRINRYLICNGSNTCQCPVGYYWNVSSCVSKFTLFSKYRLNHSLINHSTRLHIPLEPDWYYSSGYSSCYRSYSKFVVRPNFTFNRFISQFVHHRFSKSSNSEMDSWSFNWNNRSRSTKCNIR